MTAMMIRKITICLTLFLAILATLSMSCSVNGPETKLQTSGATLEGKVYYGDSVVANSMIIVVGAVTGPSTSANATSEEDGSYKVENAPLGKVTIGVNSEVAKAKAFSASMAGTNPLEKGGGKKAAVPKVLEVPKKYHDPATSGIGTEVKAGKNDFDIKLAK
jgi:hypothetical protein